MILKDINGNPYGSALILSADSDGFTAYSYDHNGVPLPCYFTASPAGMQLSNGKGTTFYGNKNGVFWVGQINNTAQGLNPIVAVGPTTFCNYVPPLPSLISALTYVTLNCIPANGSVGRQIQLTITFNEQVF